MWIPIAVFLGIVALVFGAYYALVLRQEDKFLQRLKPTGPVRKSVLRGVIKDEERMSAVAPIDQALKRANVIAPLNELLTQSGVKMTLSTFLLLTACSGLGAYLLGVVLTHIVLVGFIFGIVAALVPYWFVRFSRNRRM